MKEVLKPVLKGLALFHRLVVEPVKIVILVFVLIFKSVKIRLFHKHDDISHVLVGRGHGKVT